MKRLLLIPAFLCICIFGYGQLKSIILKNSIDSVSYALGMDYALNLKNANIGGINMKAFEQAFNDIMNNHPLLIGENESKQVMSSFFMGLQKIENQNTLENGTKFLEENKKKQDVTELPSGLQYKVVTQGSGPKPGIESTVVCHYKGSLIDGTVFDSSYERGEPIEFPLGGVIKGWIEALQLMETGSKWVLYVPSHLAYGERGAGNVIKPNETLIFEVELIAIK